MSACFSSCLWITAAHSCNILMIDIFFLDTLRAVVVGSQDFNFLFIHLFIEIIVSSSEGITGYQFIHESIPSLVTRSQSENKISYNTSGTCLWGRKFYFFHVLFIDIYVFSVPANLNLIFHRNSPTLQKNGGRYILITIQVLPFPACVQASGCKFWLLQQIILISFPHNYFFPLHCPPEVCEPFPPHTFFWYLEIGQTQQYALRYM